MMNKKGITLIALIVTIIVLVILAGFSVAVLMGDNGIINKAMKSKTDTIIGDVKDAAEIIRGDYEVEHLGEGPTSRYIIEQLIAQGKINSNQVVDWGDDSQDGVITVEGQDVHVYGRFSGAGDNNLPQNAIIAISKNYILRNSGSLTLYSPYNTQGAQERFDSTKLHETEVLTNVKTLNNYDYIITKDGRVYNNEITDLGLSNVDKIIYATYNEFVYLDNNNTPYYYNNGTSVSLGSISSFTPCGDFYLYTNNSNELYRLNKDGSTMILLDSVSSVNNCKSVKHANSLIGIYIEKTNGEKFYYFDKPNKLLAESDFQGLITYTKSTYPYMFFLLVKEAGVTNLYSASGEKLLDNVTYISEDHVNSGQYRNEITTLYVVSNHKLYTLDFNYYGRMSCLSDNAEWSIYGKDIEKVDLFIYDFTSSSTFKESVKFIIDSEGEVHVLGYAHSNVVPSKISDCLMSQSVNLFDNKLKGSSIYYRATKTSQTQTISCADWKDCWINADGSHVKFKTFGLCKAEDVDGNFYEWNLMPTLDVSSSPHAVLGVSDGKARKVDGELEIELPYLTYDANNPKTYDVNKSALGSALANQSIVNPYADYWGLFQIYGYSSAGSLNNVVQLQPIALAEMNTACSYYFTKINGKWYFCCNVISGSAIPK